ncbi:MAG: MBL fold metallo-hydrolase [Candidatus Niyogibacteria bacterium]|nr:MBL fold metallo-hydrolase [Candidatus Niyogibacteria bacterium]
MVITYYGLSCFKVSSGDFTLAFDPPSRKSALKSPRFQADVVFISHDHDNHSGYDVISEKDGKAPLKLEGPGEYETRGISMEGIPSWHDADTGKKHGANTIYTAEFETIRLCHFGDFGEKELRTETQEAIGAVDILFLPVGGDTVMDAETAAQIAARLEPRIIIPMHYDKPALDAFLKELGAEGAADDKLTIKKKDMADDKTEVRVLKPSIS